MLVHAYQTTKPITEENDLRRFLEIYELEEVDLHELDINVASLESDGPDVLKSLKGSFLRLYIIRKLFLCCLLAIPSLGGGQDFSRWRAAIDTIDQVNATITDEARKLRQALLQDEGRYRS